VNAAFFHLDISMTGRLLVQRIRTACSVSESGQGTS
jgi:hypothetical protein